MAKPPKKVKGIPIGSYEEIKDEMGRVKLKPKRKKRPIPQMIAAGKKRRWKPAK